MAAVLPGGWPWGEGQEGTGQSLPAGRWSLVWVRGSPASRLVLTGKGDLESESPVVRTSLPQAGDGKDGAQAAGMMLSEQDWPGCREVQTRPHVEKPGGRRQGA